MRGIAEVPSYVIMQPTTLCNLDCAYCYLPQRAVDRRMAPEVARATARTVNGWARQVERFSVVWHGGEPLAAGPDHLAALMAPFEGVEHHVQTNATLIDDAWCEFFAGHEVRLGVSIDGPEPLTAQRVSRGGRPAYQQIMRGITALRRNGLDFAALCVVSDPRPGLAARLYDFFLDLGCHALGINVEEREGVNARSNAHDPDAVVAFWAELTAAWRADPRLEVREVEWALRYLGAALDGTADELLPRRLDPVPVIAQDGRVVLLSPELAGFGDRGYGDFASGNVLERPLSAILSGVSAAPTGWIAEYLDGVEACRAECAYFGFCGGGHAANRYFEYGRFDGTETNHCRNSKIHLMEGVLAHAREH
ncbi:MAG TPA: cyclophane-forming radical SAM peptide maturase AmcB [Rugosimonospora sp.]|nr:cyclophane-forming radical SAM peptide maturase AmcB [Rugosimonospora sp.]